MAKIKKGTIREARLAMCQISMKVEGQSTIVEKTRKTSFFGGVNVVNEGLSCSDSIARGVFASRFNVNGLN